MKTDIQTNISAFQAQIKEVVRVGKLSMAQALNKNAVKVLIGAREGAGGELIKGAVQLTPKAKPARIEKDLKKMVPTKNGARPLIILLAAKKVGPQKGVPIEQRRQMIAAEALKIMNKRKASRTFLAAGWIKALRELGFPGKSQGGAKLRPGGRAEKSYAKKATYNALRVIAGNASAEPGSTGGEIILEALNEAIANATADMEKYTKRKMEEAMQRAAAIKDAQSRITIRG